MSVEDMADREIDRLNDEIDGLVQVSRVLHHRLALLRDLAGMAAASALRVGPAVVARVTVEEMLHILDGGADGDR